MAAEGAQLQAGGLRERGEVRYVMTDRTLYWRPYGELRDGFVYTLDLTLDGVASVTGAPLREPEALPVYTADAGAESAPFGRVDEPVTYDEVAAIFDAEDSPTTGRNEPSFLVWRRWRESTVVGRPTGSVGGEICLSATRNRRAGRWRGRIRRGAAREAVTLATLVSARATTGRSGSTANERGSAGLAWSSEAVSNASGAHHDTPNRR